MIKKSNYCKIKIQNYVRQINFYNKNVNNAQLNIINLNQNYKSFKCITTKHKNVNKHKYNK